MKKSLALRCALALLFCATVVFSTNTIASAEDSSFSQIPPMQRAVVVNDFPLNENLDQLLMVAAQKYQENPNATNGTLSVSQLVRNVVYSDGSTEKSYVITSMVLSDSLGNPIPAAVAASGSYTGQYTGNDIQMVHRMYYTTRSEGSGDSYHITKVTTQIRRNASYVQEFRQYINCFDSYVLTGDKPRTLLNQHVSNPTLNTVYTLNNTVNAYYYVGNPIGDSYCMSGVTEVRWADDRVSGDIIVVEIP